MTIATYQANPGAYMGPPYVGVVVDFLFLGLLCCQVPSYYSNFPRDPAWIKRLVASVSVLSIVKTVISFLLVWDVNIIGFGDWERAHGIPWNLWIEAPAAALMSTAAQGFFVWRCFTLTARNWYLLAALIAMLLSVLGFSTALAVQYATDPGNQKRLIMIGGPMLGIGVFVDLAISLIVSFKLVRSRRGFNARTDTLLKRLLAITWEAAAPPAISQLLNVVVYLTTGHQSTWHLAVNMLTPRLYVFSLMHSLNSRASIRLQSSQGTTFHDPSQSAGGHFKASDMARALSISALSKNDRATTGTMPVHIQTNTVVHEDTYVNGRVQSVLVQGGLELEVCKMSSTSSQGGKPEDLESIDSSRWGNNDNAVKFEDEYMGGGRPYSQYNATSNG